MSGTLVKVPAGPVALEGVLDLPAGAVGVVVFSHGRGSGRHSPRNRHRTRQRGCTSEAHRMVEPLGEQIDVEAVLHLLTHLFEEPGTLDEVARLATRWFARHLVASPPRDEREILQGASLPSRRHP